MSPGFRLRPSLSAADDDHAASLGVGVAGVQAPAFVERASPTTCGPGIGRVSPGFRLRPSLSVHAEGRHGVRRVSVAGVQEAPQDALGGHLARPSPGEGLSASRTVGGGVPVVSHPSTALPTLKGRCPPGLGCPCLNGVPLDPLPACPDPSPPIPLSPPRRNYAQCMTGLARPGPLAGSPHRPSATTARTPPKETVPTIGTRHQAGLSPLRGTVPLLHERRKRHDNWER